MQTRQVVALVIVVAIISLALGAFVGYSSSSGRTSTTTQTSTMTNSYGTLFLQSTTYTTVSQTTLSFGGSTYATTTGEYSGCIPPVQCYLTTITTVNYLSTPPPISTTQTNTTLCMVPDTGAGVYLQLISSSGEPLNNISILATPKANSCYGLPPYPQATQQETNSSGWIALEGLQVNYYYDIEFTYQNVQYNFTLPQGIGEITMANYSLPVGNLSINLCFTQPQSCNP